jgi:mannose-6-phosphate isomerase-like protein (cupin superfamily)
MTNTNIEEVVAAWTDYTKSITDWRPLIVGVTPKATACGPVYELSNPISRSDESFAIADMREIPYAEPHYHTNGETEIYIVLTGHGKVVVGGEESILKPGDVSVTLSDIAHYVIPTDNLVLVVINTPPFNAKNAVSITKTDRSVSFDYDQFAHLTKLSES